jgi:hypothetical protein
VGRALEALLKQRRAADTVGAESHAVVEGVMRGRASYGPYMSILLRGAPEAVLDCMPALHGLRLRTAEGEELGGRRWGPALEDTGTLARALKAVKQDRQLLFFERGLWPASEEAWEHVRNQLRGTYTPVGPRRQGVAVQGPNGVRWVPGGFQGNAGAGRQPQPPPRQGGEGGRSAQNGGRSGGR